MGNTINCNDMICNDNIYEIEWINEKNWVIEYENKTIHDINKSNKPYTINNGNFNICHNGLYFFKLIKKIEILDDLEKILIHFSINTNLNKEQNLYLQLYLTNDINNLNSYIINHYKINNNELIVNKKSFKN